MASWVRTSSWASSSLATLGIVPGSGRRADSRSAKIAEATVSQLAAAYDMSFAAVQKHVAVLDGAGLVNKRPQGRERIVRGEPERIRRARALLDRYEQIWRGRIAQLDALLAED